MRTRLVVALALILAACAAPAARDTESTVASPAVSSTTTLPESPPADLDTTVTTGTEADKPVPTGPPAPDFTLALGDGRTFMLAQETRPVYLVFWAEW